MIPPRIIPITGTQKFSCRSCPTCHGVNNAQEELEEMLQEADTDADGQLGVVWALPTT